MEMPATMFIACFLLRRCPYAWGIYHHRIFFLPHPWGVGPHRWVPAFAGRIRPYAEKSAAFYSVHYKAPSFQLPFAATESTIFVAEWGKSRPYPIRRLLLPQAAGAVRAAALLPSPVSFRIFGGLLKAQKPRLRGKLPRVSDF